MNFKWLSCASVLFACLGAHGADEVTQTATDQTIEKTSSQARIEIHGGPALSMATSSNAQEKTHYVFGVGLQKAIHGNIFLQGEVNFLQRGFRESAPSFGALEENEFTMSYIEVPLLVKLKADLGSRLYPYLLVGPSFGFLTSSHAKLENSQSGPDVDNFLLSANFGAGVNIPATRRSSIVIEARYSAGLSNSLTVTEQGGFQGPVKLNSLQAIAGIQAEL